MTVLFTTVPSKRLAQNITSIDLTFQLDNIEGWDGVNLAAASFGTQAYAVFRDVNSTVMELMEIDPSTIASASITILRRGLNFTGDRTTQVTANKLVWVKGTTIVELGSPSPQDFQYLKEYIDGIAIAGAPDASTTTKGISKASVAPASPSSPIFVGDNDPRVPTQGENDAMVGTGGTPATANPFITLLGTSDGSADQSQTTQNASTAVGQTDSSGNRNKIAQSFVAAKSIVKSANLYKSADTGTFAGTMTVSIQADSAGSPSGSALASKVITNAFYKQYSTGDFLAIFSSELAVTIGSTYWLVIETSTSDSANCPNLGTNSAGGYGSGSVKYKNTTDGWVVVSTIDLYFKINEGFSAKPIKASSTGTLPTPLGAGNIKTGTVATATTGTAVTHGFGRKPYAVRGFYCDADSSHMAYSQGTYDVANNVYIANYVNYNEASAGSGTVGTDCLVRTGATGLVAITVAADENVVIFIAASGTPTIGYEITG